MRKILLCLILALVVMGCHKNREALPQSQPPRTFEVARIDSVRIVQSTTDTVDLPLDALRRTYAPPVHAVHIDNIVAEVMDSLQLTIEERAHVTWNRPVYLPDLHLGHSTASGLLFPNHGMQVDGYQAEGIFPSGSVPTAYNHRAADRDINGYVIARHYKRIFFTAEVMLYVAGPKGDTAALRGRLKGSKAGVQSYRMDVY